MTDKTNPTQDLPEFQEADLTAYLLGELEPERARSVEARLEADADLRAEAELLERTIGLLRAGAAAESPDLEELRLRPEQREELFETVRTGESSAPAPAISGGSARRGGRLTQIFAMAAVLVIVTMAVLSVPVVFWPERTTSVGQATKKLAGVASEGELEQRAQMKRENLMSPAQQPAEAGTQQFAPPSHLVLNRGFGLSEEELRKAQEPAEEEAVVAEEGATPSLGSQAVALKRGFIMEESELAEADELQAERDQAMGRIARAPTGTEAEPAKRSLGTSLETLETSRRGHPVPASSSGAPGGRASAMAEKEADPSDPFDASMNQRGSLDQALLRDEPTDQASAFGTTAAPEWKMDEEAAGRGIDYGNYMKAFDREAGVAATDAPATPLDADGDDAVVSSTGDVWQLREGVASDARAIAAKEPSPTPTPATYYDVASAPSQSAESAAAPAPDLPARAGGGTPTLSRIGVIVQNEGENNSTTDEDLYVLNGQFQVTDFVGSELTPEREAVAAGVGGVRAEPEGQAAYGYGPTGGTSSQGDIHRAGEKPAEGGIPELEFREVRLAPAEATSSAVAPASAPALGRRGREIAMSAVPDADRRADFAASRRAHRERRPVPRFIPRPDPAQFADMFFVDPGIFPFRDAEDRPLSTFGLDTDTGSFTLARSYIERGALPPPEAIRPEEFVNAMPADYPEPERQALDVHVDGMHSPFAGGLGVVRIGVQGRHVDTSQRPPARLTFVIDVSGSMDRENRLELVKDALHLLLDQLVEGDMVSIVTYNTNAGLVLEPTPIEDRATIERAIDDLRPSGSTNLADGLRLGYAQSNRMFRPEGVNRIVLCSDGVANVGVTDPAGILERIGEQARAGVQLTAVGFGMGNYNDALMEQLANRGDGQYAYVDRLEEAHRVFVKEATGTLLTIAKDAKIQVEFDPAQVSAYRLIGYENRALRDRDFRNDAVDAGELGAGHTVTALYEIRWMPDAPEDSGPAVTARLRWLDPATLQPTEIKTSAARGALGREFAEAPADFRAQTVAAEFAEMLRGSVGGDAARLDALGALLAALREEMPEEDALASLQSMIDRARDLWHLRHR